MIVSLKYSVERGSAMKPSKQIFMGISSVVAVWVLQTAFTGEIGFIDTIAFGSGSEFFSNIFPIVYLLVFFLIGFFGRKRSLDTLFKAALVTGLIPAFYALVLYSEDIYNHLLITANSDAFIQVCKALSALCDTTITLLYPLIVTVYPFSNNTFSSILLIISPIICALVYFVYPLVKRSFNR